MKKTFGAFFVGRESQGGQAIVLIAITLLAMLMIVGLAIDAGQVYSARRAMQEAADAAAYAGAVTLYQGGTQTQAFNAAAADATTNGYTHNVGGVTLTVAQPTTAPYNTAEFVEVTLTKNIQTALVPAESAITVVTVHAISGAESLNNNYAIMALDTSNTAGTFDGGTATIGITGGILVNSTASGAAVGSSGSFAIGACAATYPCYVDVAGTTSGSFPAASPGSPWYYNGIRTGHAQVADPFAGYPKPGTTGMTLNPPAFGGGGNTLRSGIFDYALSGKKLCHGIYILKGLGMGGDMSEDTTSTDPSTGLTCDGKVMIFNTLSNYPLSGGTCTGVNISGNHDITLAPMATGTYAGMLFFQDANCTVDFQIASSAFDMNMYGTIYIPSASFAATGGHPNILGGQIVAKRVSLGAANVGIVFNATTSAQPKLPRLSK